MIAWLPVIETVQDCDGDLGHFICVICDEVFFSLLW
jgi:hypothetical protein